ncbi:helix-turn-helix transcriptional regulator [Tessaracoccus sp. MC1865]|uniref:helix-turn-helix transcriptional regulator n=1 Tax=Tessaracoccus sp. MC1865 TaxID=2760310 RepID=UPI001602D387|nr:helix-turn-helix transcriptional regulator [Tessaracoccus sp. MC1865]MBB1484678.1 helix-turn-helix transcriptional regulator [Tessaracoccus sp. MC1865]QTO36377.1 helix-turn-helix transcriptional regulator [Tessaracoccus sp. MC1865]
MARGVSVERVRRAILHHCGRSGLDARSLRVAVIEELRRAIEFGGYVWVLTDPDTCVGVDPLADVPGVTDLARTIRLKYATPINRWTALAQVASLGDLASTSQLWREVQQPAGVVDVASAVFRDAHGCWAFLDLWLPERLRPGQDALLKSVVAAVTTALRAAQADTLRRTPSGADVPPGPATLLMDADLRIQASTSGMDDRLRRLLPRPDGLPPVPAAAMNTAAQLLAIEDGVDRHEPQARTHIGEGQWVAVRAGRLMPSGVISVSVEPVTTPERLDLCVRAFGFTPREADVVRRVARGFDTASIAHELHLAPYTVQDHLKSIFTKAGVDTRRDLVPLLTG